MWFVVAFGRYYELSSSPTNQNRCKYICTKKQQYLVGAGLARIYDISKFMNALTRPSHVMFICTSLLI